jgi:hypothetical protein
MLKERHVTSTGLVLSAVLGTWRRSALGQGAAVGSKNKNDTRHPDVHLRQLAKPNQGAGKKQKSVTTVVGGWVRVRKRTRVRITFLIFF